jgi:DNA-binding transcriptional ArsR family regulator
VTAPDHRRPLRAGPDGKPARSSDTHTLTAPATPSLRARARWPAAQALQEGLPARTQPATLERVPRARNLQCKTTSMSLVERPSVGHLTTTEAAHLVGRTQGAVRGAIRDGHLPGIRHDGRRWVTVADLIAWDARAPRLGARRKQPAHERTADILATYGPASVDELTVLADLHPGNVRKHLAILAKEGRVERRPDGEWALTTLDHAGAA